MIKIIARLRRNPALTPEEFREYWTNVHVPLIKSKLPGLRHYAGCFPVHDARVGADRTLEDDAIIELGFDDVETMHAQMNDPEFLTTERTASSAHLMVLSYTKSVVVEVVDVL